MQLLAWPISPYDCNLCFSSFFAAPRPRQIVGVLIAKYQKGGHGDRIRQPLAGADPRAGHHTGRSLCVCRRWRAPRGAPRGAGSLLLREIRSLMHNLDKSMLTLAAHTESADAFLIKVGALPKPQPCQAELSSRNSTGLYSRNGKSAPRLAALNGNATPAASRARRSWHFCATFSALFADVPLGDQIVEVAFFVGHGDQPPV